MSLGAVLSTATRPRVPLSVLDVVLESDRIVVENIINVTFDVANYLRVTETSIEYSTNTYKIVIPFADKSCSLAYRDMQKIMSYNPGRIHDLRVALNAESRLIMIIYVTDVKTPYDVSEYDIVRIQKRRRLN